VSETLPYPGEIILAPNDVKIAVIGCGKQSTRHISGLKGIPGVELVVSDVDSEIAQSLAAREGVEWVKDVGQVFSDPEVRAVDICTPTGSHAPLIFEAIESGKDFLCEKPLCRTLAEARAIETAAEGAGIKGAVGYIYRFAPAFELARELLVGVPDGAASPVLGEIVSANFRLGGRGSHQIWKHRRASDGGAVNEMLIHMIDLAVWFLGPISKVEHVSKKLLRPRRVIRGEEVSVDAEDFVLAQLESHTGVQILCQADLVTPAFTQYVEVQGTNGTFLGSIQADLPSFLFCEREVAGYKAGRTDLAFGARNLFDAQMRDFVRALNEQAWQPRSPLRDTILSMEALERIANDDPDPAEN
jgi:predicted dehydrogenase